MPLGKIHFPLETSLFGSQRLSHTREDFSQPVIGVTPALFRQRFVVGLHDLSAACMEACPCIAHDILTRRYLTMDKLTSCTMQAAISSMEAPAILCRRGNSPTGLAKGLSVPQRSESRTKRCAFCGWAAAAR